MKILEIIHAYVTHIHTTASLFQQYPLSQVDWTVKHRVIPPGHHLEACLDPCLASDKAILQKIQNHSIVTQTFVARRLQTFEFLIMPKQYLCIDDRHQQYIPTIAIDILMRLLIYIRNVVNLHKHKSLLEMS